MLMQDKHVYVMLSESGLVKIGISQNVILRAQSLGVKPVEQKIVKIAYTETMPPRKALMYESALIGLYRRTLVENSEWCTAKFETVLDTLKEFTGLKVQVISLGEAESECSDTQAFLDGMMAASGYCMKLLCGSQKRFYLKIDGNICTLTKRTVARQEGVYTSSVREMFAYVTKHGMTLERQL